MYNFFSGIVQFWKDTWNTNKVLFLVEAASTLMGMTASAMMNFGAEDPEMMAILILYGVSAIGLAYTSYIRKTPWLVVLMSFYTMMSFVGIFKLLF